jgi:group I intron endonuclease
MDMVPSSQRYNFCPSAGSCLGVVRSAETKAAISAARLGTTRSAETKAAISESLKGEKSPIFGKSPSAETKAAISAALKGNTNCALCVYVYDSNKVLVDTFPSRTAAIKEYNISKGTIYRLLDSKKLWNNLYYFTTTPLEP